MQGQVRRWLSRFLVVGVAVLVGGTVPVGVQTDDPHRIAMVVGVSAYEDAPYLANPVNDARAVAAELWRAGYEVV